MKNIDDLSEHFDLAFKGKVRDVYNYESDKLLIYTSDRISAFDFTFDDQIKGKGALLTKMAIFWFNKTQHIIDNHLCDTQVGISPGLREKCMVVKKTKVVPIEAIVRGHLAGSAWNTYKKDKTVNGVKTNKQYNQYDRLKNPIFTPSTKANLGEKDININISQMRTIIGEELTNRISKISIDLYNYAYKYAQKRGVIIADTKFEFGLDENNNLLLIDEIFTPDCSRFWLYDNELNEVNYDAFDKQFFRDYLIKNNWNNEQILIPENIKREIISKYNTAYDLIANEV
tara:strand:+ start:108 stop:965 length:858 start_codon:yes stop_codon:yes gene_type:complete